MKHPKLTMIITSMLFTPLLSGCQQDLLSDLDDVVTDKYYVYIVVKNLSKENIYVEGGSASKSTEYLKPATDDYGPTSYLNLTMIHPGDSAYKMELHQILKDKEHRFRMNVYKQSTFDQYSQQEIIEKEMADARYCLSYKKLAELHARIIYDGEHVEINE